LGIGSDGYISDVWDLFVDKNNLDLVEYIYLAIADDISSRLEKSIYTHTIFGYILSKTILIPYI
jgi:hypothetical protein